MNLGFSKKLVLVSLLFFSFGCVFSIVNYSVLPNAQSEVIPIDIFDSTHNFLSIFKNNLYVGLLLSIGGYLSGEILTIVILYYNGYLLTDLIQSTVVLKYLPRCSL